MSRETRESRAPVARQEIAPNPLWAITVGMAVFFALGAAIMAAV